jgi:fucose 4-O-acetylase-like acetyltransferase
LKTLTGVQVSDHAPAVPPNERVPMTQGVRFLDIDHAKGFAIALVVWGHVAGATIPLTPTWFKISVGVIYAFHMPFFMYLSGYVFFAIGAHEKFLRDPAKYTVQRFNRLMIPFIGFAAIVVIGKYFAASLGPVDDNVPNVSNGFYEVLSNAPNNPCVAVWYLLCLFVYSILAPPLWRAGRNSTTLIIFVGGAGWIFNLPQSFYADRIGQYFIFFGVGGLVALHRNAILPLAKQAMVITFIIFAIACYVMLGNSYAMLVCGLAAIAALHGLFLQDFWAKDRFFLMLGNYSLTIYLLNTIAIGVFKLFYLSRFSYTGDNFYLFFPAIVLFGLFTPILFFKTVEHIPGLAVITRYLR